MWFSNLVKYTVIFLFLISSFHICKGEEGKIVNVKNYIKRVAVKRGLRIYKEPDNKSKILGLIPYGKTIWIRKEFTKKLDLQGLSGKWVFIDASYGHDSSGNPRPRQEGWVFNAFLGERFLHLKGSFREFKAGCIGVGCNVCGAIVFDPDGFFIRSIYCHGSAGILLVNGKISKNRSLLVRIGFGHCTAPEALTSNVS